ncbi:protein TonB [Parapedobacter composti]|uniref:Protein TonB n=1 Tax=Parapedobacter composti TaxID=623281 RepID=A0A1I1F231_9SPHI|nr:energy transducer TonB [Parapedobacter composti]SFB91220.1 protein TonB [Parapedobacter composti]
MWYPKQDIFSQHWLDIVFAGRNKQYGAYVLRRNAAKHANLALFIASTAFVASLLPPLIKSRYFPDGTSQALSPLKEKVTTMDLLPPPPINPTVPEPPAAAPPAPRTKQVRMPPPVVVKADQVTEEPPSVATLKLATPGPQTLEGDPKAAIHIDLPVGDGKGDAQVTEAGTDSDLPFTSVEIPPLFPGGMDAFLAYVQKNYRYPPQAMEIGINGQVILQFVVERDGSLTDIRVLRDLGFGTGEEAMRLLKASPKWSPGVQNGRPVRVTYQLSIGLAISP